MRLLLSEGRRSGDAVALICFSCYLDFSSQCQCAALVAVTCPSRPHWQCLILPGRFSNHNAVVASSLLHPSQVCLTFRPLVSTFAPRPTPPSVVGPRTWPRARRAWGAWGPRGIAGHQACGAAALGTGRCMVKCGTNVG